MRIALLLAALIAASQAQTDCSRGACYPPSDDLLMGRFHRLQASSTCGLTGSEIYCTPYPVGRMKCCPCDSRNPNGPLAHTLQEVLSTAEPDRWWQSRKEVSPVNIQLDLDNLFQLDNLILRFKGPRPSALIIERTLDNGRTWKPALYLAVDCQRSFPAVPTATPLDLEQTYCHTLSPSGPNSYHDHTIEFSPLRQYAYVPASKSEKIEGVSGITGLRVRLTELGEVPHLPGRTLSKFYALKEMSVMGSCMCHGHANRCLPETYSDPQSKAVLVNPRCDCQHNTVGVNCERCDELYTDLPWRPAEEGDTHACKRCECNNHAERCRFDQAVYEASGRRSGGVCEGCQHHTMGPKCDQCAPGYQPNPRSRMDRTDACIRCICSAEGAVNGGQCEESTGSCLCKVNVEGPHCDRCKSGFYDLSRSNPLGCTKCSCSPDGSLSDVCDPLTGQCLCRSHFHGRTCDVCSKGYWKPSASKRCEPCNCDSTRSYGDACDQVTGQCECRPGFGGRTCTECPENSYGDPIVGCKPCRCVRNGTIPEVCDKDTGDCLCRSGVTGSRCDSCSRGHCDSFPACETCPSCFFTLDAQRRNMSLALDKLASGVPSRPGGVPVNFGPRIRALETKVREIQDSIVLPPSITQQIEDALTKLHKLGDQVENIDEDISPLTKTPDLNKEVDKLKALLDSLSGLLEDKKDTTDNTVSPNTAGAFKGIKKAYDESTDATKRVNETDDTVTESADNRKEAEDLQKRVQPPNTRDLNKLNQSIAAQPDLSPVAKEVCGVVHSAPCTPLQCDAENLCPPDKIPTCERGRKCVGALPLAKKAKDASKDVKDQLDKLSAKITDATEKLHKTQDSTNQVRAAAEKLSNKMKQTRDELEDEVKDTQDVVKELKDFLSDPTSNLTHIQDVSDWIMKAKLPLSLAALQRKLDELKNLAAGLPDSTDVLNEAGPQLETAKKLLKEAQDARDKALDVKSDVDVLLPAFGSTEGTLSDLEDRLQNSMDSIDNLNNNLTKLKEKLTPAEKILDDVSKLVNPIKPNLDKLKDLLQDVDLKAQDALGHGDNATDEATEAHKDLLSLEKVLDLLKDKAAESGPSVEAGPAGDRLKKLQKDAGVLANTTADMMKALDGKADSLRLLRDQILQKSLKLEGLEAKLQDILGQFRKKLHDLAKCK